MLALADNKASVSAMVLALGSMLALIGTVHAQQQCALLGIVHCDSNPDCGYDYDTQQCRPRKCEDEFSEDTCLAGKTQIGFILGKAVFVLLEASHDSCWPNNM